MLGLWTPVGVPLLLFMVGTVIWALALIYIWFDADEVYGTGWFWALMVLLLPFITIPVYWLMKLGTHRSLDADIAASERLKYKRAWRHAHPAARKRLLDDLDNVDHSSAPSSITGNKRFTPFSTKFAPAAEHLKEVATMHRNVHGLDSACDETPSSNKEYADRECSTWHTRLSWRERRKQEYDDVEMQL